MRELVRFSRIIADEIHRRCGNSCIAYKLHNEFHRDAQECLYKVQESSLCIRSHVTARVAINDLQIRTLGSKSFHTLHLKSANREILIPNAFH